MNSQESQGPCLLSGSGADEIRIDLVTGSVWKVGRSRQSNIVLDDEMVSRSHAMIRRTGDEFLLIDLGSRNGAYLNGRRVSVPVYLKDQDKVTFGEHEFTFSYPEAVSKQVRTNLEDTHRTEATQVLFSLQQITVLVVDIRDFTGLSQLLDEAKLAQTIGSWIRRAGSILQDEGSWGQKYIGDAIMAVWVHQSGESDAGPICHAFAALSKLVEVTAGLQAEFELSRPVQIGAGLNTDNASIGNIGSGDFADYTALGDGVNKTFRLETASKQAGRDLLLGPATFAYIQKAAGDLFEEKTVELKGYADPAPAHALMYEKLPEVIELLRKAMEKQNE